MRCIYFIYNWFYLALDFNALYTVVKGIKCFSFIIISISYQWQLSVTIPIHNIQRSLNNSTTSLAAHMRFHWKDGQCTFQKRSYEDHLSRSLILKCYIKDGDLLFGGYHLPWKDIDRAPLILWCYKIVILSHTDP